MLWEPSYAAFDSFGVFNQPFMRLYDRYGRAIRSWSGVRTNEVLDALEDIGA